MPPNTDKTSIHAQLRPPSKSLGGHFFFNLWHKLGTELDEIIKQENLNPEKTRELISKSIGDGELKTSGTAISALLPAQDLFDEGNIRGTQKARVIDKLKIFFERFSAL